MPADFAKLMEWADKYRALKVRTNADTPHDAEVARGFGAEGIGLCRTEHMFFGEGRIAAVREMILADDTESRERALAKLLPIQREDFYGIFKVMEGYCPSPSVCSIRRCTSSFPRRPTRSRRWQENSG